MTRNVIVLALIFVTFASCRTSDSSRRIRNKRQGATIEPSDQAINPTPSIISTPSPEPLPSLTSQFQVFNPLFQLDKKNNIHPQVIAQVFPIHNLDGSEVATLVDGAARFSMRAQLIEKAKISVKLQSFILWADESGYAIADKLIAAKNRGVKVLVIADPVVNGRPSDHRMYFYLLKNNIKVQGYEFLYMNFNASLSQTRPINDVVVDGNMRYHEKMLIVDAEVPGGGMAIIGGANTANEYFYVDKEHPTEMWRDQDVIVKGPIVTDMAMAFDRNYQSFIDEKIRLQVPDFDQLISVLSASILRKDNGLKKPNILIQQRLATIEANPPTLNWQPAIMRFLHSRPRLNEDLIAPAYIDMIEHSYKTIDIVNAYFIPDNEFISALTRAVARGVHVRIVTNHIKIQEFEPLGQVSRTYYKALLEANNQSTAAGKMEIFECGGDIILKNGDGQNHAKFAVFDNKAAIVGSYNIDPRSRYLDAETIVAFERPEAVQELKAIVDSYVLPTYSLPISVAQAEEFAKPAGTGSQLRQQFWLMLEKYL